ncbi:MAG: hypothetical protein Q8O83_05110 [bacterium]|nr:hypothetical protein [bacterium]
MKNLNLNSFLGVWLIAGMLIIPSFAFAEELSVSFSASPQTIEKGDQATLAWSSENAVECKIFGKGITENGGTPKSSYTGLGSGIVSIAPEKTTTYSIACKGKDATFVPAQDNLTVIVTGTESNTNDSTNDSATDTTTSSQDPHFTVGCVVNPERARKGELIAFNATSVGGEGTLNYQWSGDITGGGQKIFEIFTSSGTKTATLTVTDSRNFKVTTACNVFIEPDTTSAPASNTGSTQSSSGTSGPSSNTTANQTPAETEGTPGATGSGASSIETEADTSQIAAAGSGSRGTLFSILIFSIIVNMGALFYFFVYAKKKKEERARLNEKTQFAEEMATA